jgi:hypothetical protein
MRGYDPTRPKMPDVADGYVQASPRSCSPVGMVTMYSSAEISQNTPKPMNFYNCKHKAKRALKLDMRLLAGEAFSVPPGVLPLVGGQCTVPGGFSGLFSAFEPNGLPVVMPADVLVLVPTISSNEVRHVGSSPASLNDVGVFPPRLEVQPVVV